ncbi:hypothetical protein ABEV34_04690 [Methylorubrum rhodesianum]|uniref:hypothetical protein n=1 Tax=Methylorubrum rhodesianum TaxID=29427 RepID=UPI003D2DE85A
MTNANPSSAEEIRIGVANACLRMPRESSTRREEIERLHHLKDREKDLVSEAKEEAGVKAQENRLTKVYGISKKAIAFLASLDKEKPGDRAAILTQVALLSKDAGYFDKDLVSLAEEAEATAGQGQDEQGSVFDNTPTGSRQGGTDAQPHHVDEKPVEAAPSPTPGLPPEEIVRRFEEANAAYEAKGKKGRKPKALIEATEAYEALQASEQGEQPRAAEPGEIGRDMAAGAAEGDAFLKAEAEKRSGKKAEPEPLDDSLPPPAPRRAATQASGSYLLNS